MNAERRFWIFAALTVISYVAWTFFDRPDFQVTTFAFLVILNVVLAEINIVNAINKKQEVKRDEQP